MQVSELLEYLKEQETIYADRALETKDGDWAQVCLSMRDIYASKILAINGLVRELEESKK